MIGRSRLLFPQKLIYPACCRRNQQLSPFGIARSSHTSAISRHAKLGWSLASLLGIVAVGCSWHQLNLDASQDTSSTRDLPNEPHRPTHDGPAGSVHVRYPRAYMHTSEQTVFPGAHTGIARYDTAHSDSTSYVLRYLVIRFPNLPLARYPYPANDCSQWLTPMLKEIA